MAHVVCDYNTSFCYQPLSREHEPDIALLKSCSGHSHSLLKGNRMSFNAQVRSHCKLLKLSSLAAGEGAERKAACAFGQEQHR